MDTMLSYTRNVVLPKIASVWGIISYPILFFYVQLKVMVIWVIVTFFVLAFMSIYTGRDFLIYEFNNALMETDMVKLSAITGIVVLLIVWLIKHKSWEESGFWKVSDISAYSLVLCALAGVITNYFWTGIFHLSGLPELFPGYAELTDSLFRGHIAYQVLGIAIIAPIVEEVVYRGIVLKRLLNMPMNFHAANIIQALIFGIMHLNVLQSTHAFFGGITLGLAYAKFKTIWAPIIIHITFNLWSVIIINIEKHYNIESSDTFIAITTIMSALAIITFLYNMLKTSDIDDENLPQ